MVMVTCAVAQSMQPRATPARSYLRELYPMKSDIYERANALKTDMERKAR